MRIDEIYSCPFLHFLRRSWEGDLEHGDYGILTTIFLPEALILYKPLTAQILESELANKLFLSLLTVSLLLLVELLSQEVGLNSSHGRRVRTSKGKHHSV